MIVSTEEENQRTNYSTELRDMRIDFLIFSIDIDDRGIGKKELPLIVPTEALLHRYTLIGRGMVGIGARFGRYSVHFVDTNMHHQIFCF